jgi:RND superfamily putative drug exporter
VAGASVSGASVSGASVAGASVSGASVSGASVAGASVSGASVTVVSPPQEAKRDTIVTSARSIAKSLVFIIDNPFLFKFIKNHSIFDI